jgi:hypothetical protein
MGDARKLQTSGLGLDPMLAQQAISSVVSGPAYGGLKELIKREGTSYSSYGLVSDDGKYAFEAYEFKNNRDEKWCAIVVYSTDIVLDGSITAADLSVSPFSNKDQIYKIGEIEGWLGNAHAVDGSTPTFNQRKTNIA